MDLNKSESKWFRFRPKITFWGGPFNIQKLQVGNVGVTQKSLRRVSSKRWLGKRSVVRGVVINPVDHSHWGGKGKAPIGRKKPTTPWGYPALGKRSIKRNKYSDNLILRRRLFGAKKTHLNERARTSAPPLARAPLHHHLPSHLCPPPAIAPLPTTGHRTSTHHRASGPLPTTECLLDALSTTIGATNS
ncbi:hypothetical protein R6Q57_008535 [Mikania cordata]